MKLAVQCYTVRDDLARDLWGTFAGLKGLGLNYVETGGTFGLSAHEFRNGLDKVGLKVSANHSSLSDLQSDIDKVIELNRAIGSNCVVLSSVGKDLYGQGWAHVARTIEPIGKRLLDAGLMFSYHNHSFEFELENGKPGLDILYEKSDPKYVQAQIDTYWVAYGGGDPAGYIRKLKNRLPHAHLKDGRLGGEPDFLEIGQGALDWDAIVTACTEANVECGAIELDFCPREPMESVRTSVEFLRAKGVID